MGRINEDVYILYALVSQCKKIAATDQIGYYYLFRAGSIMNRSGSLRKLTNPEAGACPPITTIRAEEPIWLIPSMAKPDLIPALKAGLSTS